MLGFLHNLRAYKFEAVSFVAGAVVLTFELTASRIVAPYIGTTIYVWTSIIGVILGALALGYTLGGYLADKRHRLEDIIWFLLLAALLICLVNFSKDWLLEQVSSWRINPQIQALITSLFLFAPATVVLAAVSPYLMRLSFKDLSSSGRKVARISTAGTLGSLIGTFITGYFLFGFVGTKYILGWMAVGLTLTSFILNRSLLLIHRLLLVVLFTILALLPPSLKVSGLNKELDTRYSRVLIRDVSYQNRPVRILQMDRLFLQSGIYTDGDSSLVFPYTQSFASVAKVNPRASDFLVIGGGAYTFPAYLAKNFPSAKVSVVEIDDKLATISKDYFNFHRSKNIQLFDADGRQFLNQNTNTYGVIFIDAFNSFIPPFQLFTKEATAKLHSALSNKGVLASNVISSQTGPKSSLAKAIVSTYNQVFKNVRVYKVHPNVPPSQAQNLTVLASDIDLPNQLVDNGNVFAAVEIDSSSNFELTDDFAPVEKLAADSFN